MAEPENGRKDEPASTTSSSIGLPPMKHFRIGDQRYGAVHDCYVNDNAVTCTLSMEPSYSVQSYEGTVTGTLSGLTLTGTQTTHQRYPDETDRSCIWTTDTSDPVTYVFSLDGTVAMRGGTRRGALDSQWQLHGLRVRQRRDMGKYREVVGDRVGSNKTLIRSCGYGRRAQRRRP